MINMIKTTLVSTAILTVSALGAPASADRPGSAPMQPPLGGFAPSFAEGSMERVGRVFFRMMDGNGDGIVTREERAAAAHQEWLMDFAKLDLNGDGRLTRDEYLRALKKMHPPLRGQEV